MIAFEVYLNNEKVCTAGAEDLAVLSTVLSAGGVIGKNAVRPHPNAEEPEFYCSVSGLTGRPQSEPNEHLHWKELDLKVGDTFAIKIVETAQADLPEARSPAGR